MKVTKENLKKVIEKILNKVVTEGNLVYFNIGYWDSSGISPCHFSPVVPHKARYVFVDDYEKILVMLLTHPNIKDIEYNEKEGCISAFFEVPEEYGEEEEWGEDDL